MLLLIDSFFEGETAQKQGKVYRFRDFFAWLISQKTIELKLFIFPNKAQKTIELKL